jgi:hypothetical protein
VIGSRSPFAITGLQLDSSPVRTREESCLATSSARDGRDQVPALEDLGALTATSALWVCRFGDLHLLDGQWPVIGKTADWGRDAWLMPEFARYEELTGRTYKVKYADDDPNRLMSERPTSEQAARSLPEDGMAGAGFVEVRLTSLLG